MKRLGYGLFVAALLSCVWLAQGCTPQASAPRQSAVQVQPISAQNFQLDTLVTVTIYDSDNPSLLTEVFDEIDRLESILSASLPDSDPALLALYAGIDYIEVTEDTLVLLRKNAYFAGLSDGAFDCTVGPLVALWGIREGQGHFPTEDELRGTMPLIDDEYVHIRDDGFVMLEKPGMKLDFGAIAKGYIGDRVKELLISKDVRSAVIDLGGNVVLLGEKPGGADFRVGVRDPDGGASDYFGVFEAVDISLVSSGSYERFFLHEGKPYHHILDIRTGFPADNELLQVTILSASSTDCDAYSTTAFLLGLERGFALVNDTVGVEGLFVTKDHKVYATDGIGAADDAVDAGSANSADDMIAGFTLVSPDYAMAVIGDGGWRHLPQ